VVTKLLLYVYKFAFRLGLISRSQYLEYLNNNY